MRVLIPFDARDPNTRLSPLLSSDERTAFAEAMLADVLEAVRGAGGDPTVLTTAPVDVDAPVTVDDRALSPAIDDALADASGPLAIVMADLALATPAALAALFDADGGVVLAPGLGGGTNAMVVRHPDFHVDYHGASIRDHRRIARDVGATVGTVDSFRLAVDVDEPPDLLEVLIHGDGRAADWLHDRGFELVVTDDGRPSVDRTD